MVRNQTALGEEMAGSQFPVELIQNQAQEPEKLGSPEQQVPREQQSPPEQPETQEKPVGNPQGPKEPTAAASPTRTRDPPGEKTVSLRPAFLRVPQPSLGYGSFRCRGSASSEQLQGRGDREGTLALVPVPAPAEAQPREGETSTPGALREPGEAGSGAWAPVELQVDVRVKPVGAAVSGLSPSPVPTTRFFSVPVPDSPAFSRHSSFSRSGVPRTPSPGSTWGGSPHPLAGWADRYREQEGRASPGPVRFGESPSGLPRCRCRELGLEDKEWEKLLPGCGADGDKLHQAITRIGAKCRPCPEGWVWSEEHCYYLSLEVQSWEDSKAFCSAHQASLPVLSHTQDFLSRYQTRRLYWVGLHRGSEGWHWINGAPLAPQLLPEEDEDSLQNQNCGGLEEGKLKALECASSRPWICVRGTK
ncbi:killer cell lectin-like receptor subfamily G member 2 isoform X2 [Petaurus breviceps papuanus]|uniref:killer cell lectin-like receptor subfamily G member 2 isoform X2 n=1 Tax=Petaurus breviceps papuanus TaxID=3040969 RepID=UPI0036DCCC7F